MTAEELIAHIFPDYDKWNLVLKARLMEKIKNQLQQGANEAANDIGISPSWNVRNPEVLKWIDDYTIRLSTKINKTTHDKLRNLIRDKIDSGTTIPQLKKQIKEEIQETYKGRAEAIARTEVKRAQESGRHEQMRKAGAKRKVWHTNPDCCDYCKAINGKTVGIEDNFFAQGDVIELEQGKLKLDYEDTLTAPLHPKCRCYIKYSWEDLT